MKKITILLVLLHLGFYNLVNGQCATSSAPTNNCTFGDLISAFSLNSISATGNSGCGASGYNSFSAPIWTLQIGNTYAWTATVGSGLYNEGVGIWIDLNNDGSYATTEFIAATAPALNHSGSFLIPYSATAGVNLRMRVRCAYAVSVTNGQACTNSIGSYGETEDYFVYLTCPATTPSVSVAASATLVCSATNAVVLTASGLGTYNWSGGISNGVTFNPSSTTSYTVTAGISGCPTSTATAARTISVNPTPTVTGISSGSICPGVSYAMTPGGASSYTYSSSGGTLTGSSVTVTPIVTTSYTVSATASNGCISSVASSGYATVTTLASPTLVTASTPTGICPGFSSNLTVSGANSYTWTSPASNATAVSVSPGATAVYTVSGTGTNVCNGVKTVTVTVYPQPTITVNSGTLCAGKTFTMVPGGASTYTFSNGSNTVAPSTSTFYTVSGTNVQGCVSATAAVSNITIVALPVVTVPSGTICNGSQFVFTPGGATSYTFVNASNPVSPTVTTTYSITGSTTVGCTSLPALVTVTVFNLPTLTVASTPTDMIICQTSPINFAASGASTYTWNNVTSGATFSDTPTTNTNYFVVGTDANGCVNFASYQVTVNPLPVVTLASTSTFVCVNGSATLTASGANTYTWTTNSSSTSVVVSPSVTSVYGVTGTSTLGCSKTMTTTINVNTITLIVSSNTAVCAGNSANLTANAGNNATYLWSNNSIFGATSVTPAITTTYTVNATDNKTCHHTGAVTVTVNTLPNVIASSSRTLICKDELQTLHATGAATLSWGSLGSGDSVVVTASSPGTFMYIVTGTDNKGCMSGDTISIKVDKCTGINEIVNGINGLSVYPNPNTGIFTIELNNGLTKNIQVIDLTGRTILSKESNDDKTSVNLHGFAGGVYYVKIQSDKKVEIIKVIKQ
jgi:hypothetical protein